MVHQLAAQQPGHASRAARDWLDPESSDEVGLNYPKFVNPYLSGLLERLRVDKTFVRGEGSVLYDAEGTAYLDAVAGYGAVPFGHNPECIWQALHGFEASREPAMVQPSVLAGAGDLAAALLRCAPAGLKYAAFASSGTEAVEVAIKACRLASGRLGIISTEGGFHGKTLGALSATGRDQYQVGTGAPAPGFTRVPYGDADALEAAFDRQASETAAFIVEPIQGEGGVIEPPAGYLKLARRLCDRHGVRLIVDEIQTGLGRTGELFACLAEGVSPDALTLAKALGGGLLPVSACLLSERAYSKAFAHQHSSTFGGNALGMRVGLRVLERLTTDDGALLDHVQRRAHQLQRGLRALQREYPTAIREVRGRGLMLGVELGSARDSFGRGWGSLLAALEQMQGLAAMAASYLLNTQRVRVAPTLNAGNVLRVQPPLTVTREECDQIVEAFRQLASVLASGQSDALVAHLARQEEEEEVTTGVFAVPGVWRQTERKPEPEPEPEPGRFAFIVHLLDNQSFADFDTSLARLDASALERFADRFESLAQPLALARVRVTSIAGAVALGDFIAIPKTAQQLLRLSISSILCSCLALRGMASVISAASGKMHVSMRSSNLVRKAAYLPGRPRTGVT